MASILEALATDHLCVEPAIYKSSSELRTARARYCELGEKLMERLSEEDRKILEDYRTAKTEESVLYGNDRFIKGFRLGILMMMEVVMNEDDLILHEGDCV